MSGTSIDSVDAVLLDLAPTSPRLRATLSFPFPAALRDELQALVGRGAAIATGAQIWRLDALLGALFADATLDLLRDATVVPDAVAAIGSHGQTVYHAPNALPPVTVQLGDPNIIAERTGITTVADFRRRDIAASGQGAPLLPAFHNAFLRTTQCDRAVVNIGGIANVTLLPSDPAAAAIGFDTGPGNTLMDTWIAHQRGDAYDRNGKWAASGNVIEPLLRAFLSDDYFQAPAPKSTGREHFNLSWTKAQVRTLPSKPRAEDVQRTLLELTAATIADSVEKSGSEIAELWLCGGGSHNGVLVGAIAQRLPGRRVDSTAHIGFAPDWLEAAGFAWLAHRTLNDEPGNLPSVTGADREVILGSIYPALRTG